MRTTAPRQSSLVGMEAGTHRRAERPRVVAEIRRNCEIVRNYSKEGCVIEEVSSTHYVDDSYYTDETITENENRKTIINYWVD